MENLILTLPRSMKKENKILKAINYGAEWRMKSNSMAWPDKGTPQFYKMLGFEKAIVWYQKYLKSLLSQAHKA